MSASEHSIAYAAVGMNMDKSIREAQALADDLEEAYGMARNIEVRLHAMGLAVGRW